MSQICLGNMFKDLILVACHHLFMPQSFAHLCIYTICSIDTILALSNILNSVMHIVAERKPVLLYNYNGWPLVLLSSIVINRFCSSRASYRCEKVTLIKIDSP
jgi:hypothetical protein